MLEIRFHGRGGQGTVNAAQMLAKAMVKVGKYAQFIPAFGVERKGSPVFGYFRLDDQVIWPKNQVYYPDGVVIMDYSLLRQVPVFEGLKDGGFVVLNTKLAPEEVEVPDTVGTLACVDATAIAREVVGREIPNTVVLGALAKTRPAIDFDALGELIGERYGAKNRDAYRAGYERVRIISKKEAD